MSVTRELQREGTSKIQHECGKLVGPRSHFELRKDDLNETKMEEMKNVLYAFTVNSLMYSMICTWPNIAFIVGVVNGHLANPNKEHWLTVKWIMRYLKGTSILCSCFRSNKPLFVGHTDANMASDLDIRRSTSSFVVTFVCGGVSWQSILQKCVALSTTEAKFIATTEVCKEMLWIKIFLNEIGFR